MLLQLHLSLAVKVCKRETSNERPMSTLRSIEGTVGSRIRVILGDTGNEWLLILNKDNGTRTWQEIDWKSIPNAVAKQINNCTNKGRDIKMVDFGRTGSWYVNGEKPDDTAGHSWWGNTDAGDTIKEFANSPQTLKVSFGCDDYFRNSHVLLKGSNGYSYSSNIPSSLTNRLKRINHRKKAVQFVRLFDSSQFFISDDEGTQWSIKSIPLSTTLHNSRGVVEDVALAGDGSWVVIEGQSYTCSQGVDPKLSDLLFDFYNEQRRWINDRRAEIVAAECAAAREQREREERESQERERLERESLERERRERAREERERQEREAEAAASTRVSTLEAMLEKRLLHEADDIKRMQDDILKMQENLQKRKRSLKESIEELPANRRTRISFDTETPTASEDPCAVCHDKKRTMAVVPCGHLCLCETCSATCMEGGIVDSRACPLCRGAMTSTIRIYW